MKMKGIGCNLYLYCFTMNLYFQMEWLKYHPPTRENISTITKYLKETFAYRRALIDQDSPSITSIIDSMPRFRDTPELVSIAGSISNLTYG